MTRTLSLRWILILLFYCTFHKLGSETTRLCLGLDSLIWRSKFCPLWDHLQNCGLTHTLSVKWIQQKWQSIIIPLFSICWSACGCQRKKHFPFFFRNNIKCIIILHIFFTQTFNDSELNFLFLLSRYGRKTCFNPSFPLDGDTSTQIRAAPTKRKRKQPRRFTTPGWFFRKGQQPAHRPRRCS